MRRCADLSILPSQRLLLISLQEQTMRRFTLQDGAYQLSHRYAISSSAKPPSCQADSFGTPTGLHAIADCIGQQAPLGMVFEARTAIGKCYWELSPERGEKNLITSRILRLKGLEPGLNSGPNCDSYDRYIYIHGTNHEARIGRPFSSGCIELYNTDIVELFELMHSEDLVYIS